MFHKHFFQLLKFNVKTLMKKAYHGDMLFSLSDDESKIFIEPDLLRELPCCARLFLPKFSS
jgi:hypothetical protein